MMLGLQEEVNRWVHAAEVRAGGHKINKKKNWGKNKICRNKKDPTAERLKFPFFFSVFLPNKLVTLQCEHRIFQVGHQK